MTRKRTRDGFTYYDLDPLVIRIGMLCGLMRKAKDEDVYELTPKGKKWLDEWCSEQIAIARMWAH